MAITINKNTTQAPITTPVGNLTGLQSIKFIHAPRIYVKTSVSTSTGVQTPVAESLSAAPGYFVKSNGVTPTGWTDLGVVEGKAKIGVQKKTKEVKTGIDNYFRAAYTNEKVGTCEFALSQLDDLVFGAVTGLTASIITSGSIVSYNVGSEDLNQIALMLVVQNKLDGKEIQFYNPNAYLNFSIEEQGDELQLKVMGMLPFFFPAGSTKECMLSQTHFA